MLGSVLVTILVFVLAVVICITLNFVMVKSAWDFLPRWVQQGAYICCVALIMISVYSIISHIWGVQ